MSECRWYVLHAYSGYEKKDKLMSAAIVIILIILFSLFFLLTDQVRSFAIKKIIQIGASL